MNANLEYCVQPRGNLHNVQSIADTVNEMNRLNEKVQLTYESFVGWQGPPLIQLSTRIVKEEDVMLKKRNRRFG